MSVPNIDNKMPKIPTARNNKELFGFDPSERKRIPGQETVFEGVLKRNARDNKNRQTNDSEEDDSSRGGPPPITLFALVGQQSATKEASPKKGAAVQGVEGESLYAQNSSSFDLEEKLSEQRNVGSFSNAGYSLPQFDNPLTFVSEVKGSATTATVERVEQISALVSKLVDSVASLQSNGQTDTIVTIKDLPLFKDASIVISAFDSAKGELNVSFYNLTQEAQQLLDSPMNRELLQNALRVRELPLQLQMMTTTTQPLPPNLVYIATEEHHFDRDQSDSFQQEKRNDGQQREG